ncbi:Nif3-like dinuclear metal center hexameric protein [Nitrincola alkalisediminis]|uniref:Nif3-like dinuclear metal center hexameric protein n=1 Tax=Nitrincola alkalisediminis TaxID=1366656 RepID=UPI00187635C0|nr:Nif3-like dinuclear metal center hexameric protein [Nitrincola alkalisediminis]
MNNPVIEREALLKYCHELLKVDRFKDYCPNGLQVQGRSDIRKIMTGVTACQALIDEAVAWGADMLLVHHGYFWKGESEVITGIKYQRLKTLLANDINLVAYHLPLDAHPELGNNVQLADRLGFVVQSTMEPNNPFAIGNIGALAEPLELSLFSQHLERVLQRVPQVIAGGAHPVGKIAWCTGAADKMIESAYALGADTYISGEISEPVVHFAREAGIHYIAAGHHATERYGIQALGQHLADRWEIEHRFVDIDNPV